MATKLENERALREILDALGNGSDPRPLAHSNNNPGFGTQNPWPTTPTPYVQQPVTTNRSRYTMREHLEELVHDMFTRGTLAHVVATFVVLFAILAGTLWVMVTFVLPTLKHLLADLLVLAIPLFVILFGMCLMVSSLFRR